MASQVHHLFVFGTLKEGFPNFTANHGTRVAGSFKTVDRLPLYLVGARNSPWLLDQPGTGQQVLGQVFEVDDLTLERMDVLERVAEPDGYRRALIQVQNICAGGKTMEVFAYLKPVEQLDPDQISAGPLTEYTLDHAMRYRKRSA